MKKRNLIITAFLSTLVLAALVLGCNRQHEADSLLASADSLASVAPDSALRLLDGYEAAAAQWPERLRMRYRLLQANAQNKAFIPFTADSAMLRVTSYYDRHGSPNDRMLAYYLLGAVYRDLGEVPQALDYLHRAAECADTASSDCDFRLLARVHGQMTEQLYDQLLPYDMLDELTQQEHYGRRGNDTIMWLRAYSGRASAYELLEMYDSVYAVTRKAYHLHLRYGLNQLATDMLGILIYGCVETGHYEEARQYMNIYESTPSCFSNGEVRAGREVYYSVKAQYYLDTGQPDSARYWLYKELAATDLNNREAAYKGLHSLYQALNMPDSIAKYAELSYQANEQSYQELATEKMRHMQSLYNYTRHQQIAQQKTRESERYRLQFLGATLLCLLLGGGATVAIRTVRKRRRAAESRLREEYDRKVATMEQAKYDLQKMKEQEYAAMMAEKEAIIQSAKEQIAQLESRSRLSTGVEERLSATPVYRQFRHFLSHPKERIRKTDWQQLQDTVEREIPHFYAATHAGNDISETEYRICLLTRLYFSASEIAILTGQSYSNSSMQRKRLLKKIWRKEGTAEEFDRRVRAILPSDTSPSQP